MSIQNCKMDTTVQFELYRQNVAMCDVCHKNNRRASMYRNAAICSLVTCAAFLVISIAVNAFVVSQEAKLSERLNDLEQTNDMLKSRLDFLEEALVIFAQRPNSQNTNLQRVKRDVEASSFEVDPDLNIRHKRKTRKARKPRKKKCKNCLPVVQIEGAGGFSKANKTDLTGFWKTSKWASSPAKYFDTKQVNQHGKLKVAKDGLYLLYAQMNIQGPEIAGMEIFKQESFSESGITPSIEILATCKRNTVLTSSRSETCLIMKVVNLRHNTDIFVRELDGNSSVHYLPKSNFFGLIKVGNFIEV